MKGLILFILMYWIYPSGDKISYIGEYKILPQSKVYLAGTSNVNKFSCDCVHDFENQVFKADAYLMVKWILSIHKCNWL